MSRRFLILLLFLLPAFEALSQPSDIRGVVSDSLTGERIPYANVVLINSNRGAAANGAGFFLIPSVPPGVYEISASVVGYRKITKKITVRGGSPVEVNFRLPTMAIETKEVVVSGAAAQQLLDVQTSVHVMDAKEMKLTPVPAQEDVLQSLKILPGIVSTSDASSKFYVRGGAGDQNLVRFDGMKIYNPFHALGVFSVLDPDIVRTTEVYTGAFPPGYGGRLSSIINVTSRDGHLNKVAGKANINFLSSKLQLEGPVIGGLSFLVNGRKSLFSQTYSRLIHEDAPVRFYDFFAKATSTDTSGAKLEVSFLTSADDLKFASPTQPDYFWENRSLGVKSSGLTGDRLFVVISGSWSTFQARQDAKQSTTVKPASTSVKEISVRANATYYSDDQDFYVFGFDLAFPKLEYQLVNNLDVNKRISELTTESSAWINFQSTFGRVQLSTGLHIEIGSLFTREMNFDYIQPRLSMSYRLDNEWRLKASYGRITQNVITATNEDDIISIFDPWIVVPSTLHSEESDHYVLGAEGPIDRLLWASIQAYYKDNTSLVTYNSNKIDASDPDYINGHGVSAGVEVVLRSNFSFMDLYATYALATTRIDNLGFVYYPRYDRRHHINILTTFHPLDNLTVNLRWEFGSGFPYTQTLGYFDRLTLTGAVPGPFEVETGQPYILLGDKNAARLPDYHRLDVSATYDFSLGFIHGSGGISIMNAYNNKNVFYFDRKTGQRVDMLSFFPSATLTLEF